VAAVGFTVISLLALAMVVLTYRRSIWRWFGGCEDRAGFAVLDQHEAGGHAAELGCEPDYSGWPELNPNAYLPPTHVFSPGAVKLKHRLAGGTMGVVTKGG